MNENQKIGVKQERHYTVIPDEVIRDNDLNKTELLVYIVLCSHADKAGHCWPGLKMIERESRSTKPSVIKAIKQLENKGFIRKENRRNPKHCREYESNFYIILDKKVVKKRTNGSKKEDQRGSKKEDQEVYTFFEEDTEKNNNTAVVVESSCGPLKIPQNIIEEYGTDTIKAVSEHMPADVINKVGWVISALKQGWEWEGTGLPRGALPISTIPELNGPGVHWNPRDSHRVYFRGKDYVIQNVNGQEYAIPEVLQETGL